MKDYVNDQQVVENHEKVVLVLKEEKIPGSLVDRNYVLEVFRHDHYRLGKVVGAEILPISHSLDYLGF